MNIRILGTSDVETFQRVRLRALQDHPSAFGSSYEDEARRPLSQVSETIVTPPERQITVGAFIEDTLVGVGSITRMPGIKRQHRAVVSRMYVTPETRGQGVGRAIIDALVNHARTWQGLEHIVLNVETNNISAIALYEKAGFVYQFTEPKHLKVDGEYYDLYWMMLSLG